MNHWQSHSTSAELAASITRLETQRGRSFQSIDNFSQEQIDRRLEQNRWSPGEVFDHLLRFDYFIQSDLRSLIDLARKGEPTKIRHGFRDLDVGPACIPKSLLPFFATPFQIATTIIPKPIQSIVARTLPIQNPEFATPERFRTKHELRSDMESTLSDYHLLLTSNSDLDYGSMIISHPLLGTNSVLQIPDFVAVHEQQHLDKMLALQNKYANRSF